MLPPRPPDPQQKPATPILQSQSRALGMNSILNPAQTDPITSSMREQRASTIGVLTARASPESSAFDQLPTLSPRILKRPARGSSSSETPAGPLTQEARRFLTPRSPALRAASLGPRSSALSPTSRSETLSLPGGGRVYTAEPGRFPEADVPPLPLATGPSRYDTSYPPLPSSHRAEARQAIGGRGILSTAALASVPTTQSESPSTSHPSFSQFSQASAAGGYPSAAPAQSIYPPLPTVHSLSHPQHGLPQPALSEAHYDVGHGSYQMTLDTQSGPMIVPVEVDVQQASKMADEKRKRNAGASARFRARRKEKEKEANTTIDSLQKVIRDVTEDKDFYVNERNFYRELAARVLGPNQLPPRPASPEARRPLPPPPTSMMSPEEQSSRWQDGDEEGSVSPVRSQRRRTGDYQPSFGHRPSMSPMVHPQSSAYGPPFPAPPLPTALQPSLFEPRPPAATNPPLPPTRPTTYDPFRQETYDRSWNPGR